MKRFNTGLLLAAAVLIICHGFPSYGKEEKEGFIEYTVSFVDAADHDNRIFNSQQGQAPEGTAIHVSFPEQIIGADGHIWRAPVFGEKVSIHLLHQHSFGFFYYSMKR